MTFILSVLVGVVLGGLISQLIYDVFRASEWEKENQKKLKRDADEKVFWSEIYHEIREARGNVLVWPSDKFDLINSKMGAGLRYRRAGLDREHFLLLGKVILRGEEL